MASAETSSSSSSSSSGDRARIRIKRLAKQVQAEPRFGRPAYPSVVFEETKDLDGLRSSIVVIGASVLDVHLTCEAAIPASTVPGKIAFQHGGVGRNIVECLGRLKQRPLFISAVGHDAAGREILSAMEDLGVPTRGVKVCTGSTTSVVACSFDESGNLTSGVADTALLERELTKGWVVTFQRDIECAKLLVLEANLTAEILEFCFEIASKAGVPVFFEPVSVSKSVRIVPFLSKVSYMSPNEAELKAIAAAASGQSNRSDVANDTQCLHSLGVKNVLVTRGKDGCQISIQGGRELMLPSLNVRVINVNGAGDCLVAGTLKALVENNLHSLEYAVSYGIAVACAAIQSASNVPEIKSTSEIDADALHVFSRRISM